MTRLFRKLIAALDPPAARHYRRIAKSVGAVGGPTNKGYVVFLPFRLNPDATWVELVLANAFRLRGYEPVVLFGDRLCPLVDGHLSGRNRLVPRVLDYLRLNRFVSSFGLKPTHFRSLLSAEQRSQIAVEAYSVPLDDIANYSKYGVDIGRNVQSSLCRYFLRGSAALTEDEVITRKYFHTALLSLEASSVVCRRFDPALLISSHGIYSTWGVFCDYFKAKQKPFISWGFQYKKNAFIFSHNKSYHEDIITEGVDKWISEPVSSDQISEAVSYLKSKGSASHSDAISYYEAGACKLSDELQDKLDAYDYALGVFPNISWDAQISFRSKVFKSMNEWVLATVEWASNNPKILVIVRAHPAEKRPGFEVKETVRKIISENCNPVPENVVILDESSDPSSYDVLELVDVCVVYGSKFGLEAAVDGKPVIVAGDAYYSGKGISFDAKDMTQYRTLLSRASRGEIKPSSEMIEMAKKFAYHYHVRRQTILKLADLKRSSFSKFLFDNERVLCDPEEESLENFINSALSGKPFWTLK